MERKVVEAGGGRGNVAASNAADSRKVDGKGGGGRGGSQGHGKPRERTSGDLNKGARIVPTPPTPTFQFLESLHHANSHLIYRVQRGCTWLKLNLGKRKSRGGSRANIH